MRRSKVEEEAAACSGAVEGVYCGWSLCFCTFGVCEFSWRTSAWPRGASRGPPAAGRCGRCGCRAPPAAALDPMWRTERLPPPPYGSQRRFPDRTEETTRELLQLHNVITVYFSSHGKSSEARTVFFSRIWKRKIWKTILKKGKHFKLHRDDQLTDIWGKWVYCLFQKILYWFVCKHSSS